MADENTDSSREAGGADDKSKAGDKPAGDAAQAGDTSKAHGKIAEEKTFTQAEVNIGLPHRALRSPKSSFQKVSVKRPSRTLALTDNGTPAAMRVRKVRSLCKQRSSGYRSEVQNVFEKKQKRSQRSRRVRTKAALRFASCRDCPCLCSCGLWTTQVLHVDLCQARRLRTPKALDLCAARSAVRYEGEMRDPRPRRGY
jgi:hypothetical protein